MWHKVYACRDSTPKLWVNKQTSNYGKTWLKTNKYQSENMFCSHCLKTVISYLFKQGFQSVLVDNLQSDGMQPLWQDLCTQALCSEVVDSGTHTESFSVATTVQKELEGKLLRNKIGFPSYIISIALGYKTDGV